MKKDEFQKKWYFRLIQVIFAIVFVFWIVMGTVAIFYEDDLPFLAGYLWAIVTAIIYWIVKKTLYYFHKK